MKSKKKKKFNFRWSFKSLKQLIKILAKEKNYKEIIQKMEQVLQYSSVVTKNIFEKSIFKILTFLKEDEVSFSILKEIYERILTKVQSVNKV
jgi:hypothetical protein